MKIEVEELGEGQKVIHISGEITTSNAAELEEQIDGEINMGDNVVLDFAEVPYMSSAGIRTLMLLEKKMKDEGELSLKNVNDMVYEVLRTVKLVNFIKIEGKSEENSGDEEEEAKEEDTYTYEDYEVTSEEIEIAPIRIRKRVEAGNIKAYAAIDEDSDNTAGFILYHDIPDDEKAVIDFIYAYEKYRGKGLASKLVKKLEEKLSEDEVEEIVITSLAGYEGGKLAGKLGYEKTKDTNTILKYTIKQIMESKLYAGIDKLRNMFDKVKVDNELDYLQKMQLDMMINGSEEDIDPVFSRFFVVENEVVGVLKAAELEEGKVWVRLANIESSNETNTAIPLMLASMIDSSCAMLGDDGEINIICDKDALVKGYESILGEPAEVLKDEFYSKILE